MVAGCRDALAARLGVAGVVALTPAGLDRPLPSPFLAGRAAALEVAPAVTVVICTREHPDTLRDCLISLTDQEFTRFDVLVVDNAPASEKSKQVVEEFTDRLAIRYAVARRPGLSRARNKALSLLGDQPGERIVAWTDDDVRVDPHWVAEIARAFVENPVAVAVSGAVVPAELRTRSQIWFEQFGGHSKGRGFTPDEFGPGSAQSPLYPLLPELVARFVAVQSLRGVNPA